MYSILSLSYLLPEDLLNKIRNVVLDDLYEATKKLQNELKDKVTLLTHYKNYNIETLSQIKTYPKQVGLFWTGKLDKKYLKSQDLIVESFINDIFLLPTFVFASQNDLIKFIENSNKNCFDFIYKNKQIYYFDRFLPFGTKEHSDMLIFYGKIFPIL